MKKRRTIIISLLLVAALALGIGYAATSGDVSVNGKVKNHPHELKLVFEKNDVDDAKIIESRVGTVEGSGSESVSHTLDVTDGADFATFNISDLAHKDDYIKAVLTVKNTNQYDVVLTETPTPTYSWTKGSNFFVVSTEWVDDDPSDGLTEEDLTLEYNQTKRIYVTITMTAEATAADLEGDFVLSIPATGK